MDACSADDFIALHLNAVTRWDVFKRLQELAVPCACRAGQPLRVALTTPTAALQVWSVVQGCLPTQPKTVNYLERCWQRTEGYDICL
jgi:hypothetical protein